MQTIPDQIRDVLRSADGPLTNAQIREQLDDGATSEDVGGALHYMTKTGEVAKLDGERPGKYVLDKSFVPKQKRTEPVAPPSKVEKSPKATPAVAKRTNGHVIAVRDANTGEVNFPRAKLRALVDAVMASNPSPLRDDLRELVLFALAAAL